MNGIDIFLVIIVLLSVWSGWRKGFILGSLDLLMLALGLASAYFFYPFLSVVFEKYIPSLGVWITPLSFILVYIFTRLFLGYIVNKFLKNLHPDTHQTTANRLLGTLPGFVNGLLYATIISALLLAVPLFDGVSEKTRESRIAERLSPGAEWIESKLSPVFDDAVNRSMNKLTVKPDSKESINLHFTVKNPKVREDLEAKMLVMVNEERAKEGLPPLKADPELTQVARAHSRDMFARGYFAHDNPDGEDPFDRMRRHNVKFLTAGENLALAQTLRLAHTGLMNSPGHRANILHKSFGRLGIGIVDGGIYGLMVSQEFRN